MCQNTTSACALSNCHLAFFEIQPVRHQVHDLDSPPEKSKIIMIKLHYHFISYDWYLYSPSTCKSRNNMANRAYKLETSF